MNDPSSNPCPECGNPVPAESQHHICPACLMAQALASQTLDGEKPPSYPPPEPEEIADKFPQFEILECLGRGGMGIVYKARQKSLNRLVAIKILAPEREHDARFAERFAREAELLAKLSHPHIVTIHDFGETGGLYFLVMEFVDGVNLRDLLREGKLESKQALAIVPPICEALQYAHDKGIVHRDIKPENLLLDRDGRIKIADFGIASLIGASAEKSGTPPYMAPEQRGVSTEVDHRADIYALGVVFYEMLTGERPAENLVAPSKKTPLDARLDEMVLRALEKEPGNRYQTAGEMRTMVATLDDSNGQVSSAVAGQVPLKKSKGDWWIFQLLLPLGLLLGLATGAIYCHFRPPIYFSLAIVRIQPPTDAQEVVSDENRRFAALVEILRSKAVLGELDKKLGLSQRWMLNEQMVIVRLREMMEFSNGLGNNFVIINVHGSNCDEPVEIANSFAKLLQDNYSATINDTASWPAHAVSQSLWPSLTLGGLVGVIVSALLAWLVVFGIQYSRLQRINPAKPPKTLFQSSRFSRPEIVGAVLIPIFILVVSLWFVLGGPESLNYVALTIHPIWTILLMMVLLFAAVLPLLTTILGWVSICRIRRFAGAIDGLWMAVFDGLFFPLLVLDGLVAYLVHTFGIAFHFWTQNYTDEGNTRLILITVLFSLIADFFIVRAMWRRVNRPVIPNSSSTLTPPRKSSHLLIGCGVICLLLFILFLLFGGSFFWLRKSNLDAERQTAVHRAEVDRQHQEAVSKTDAARRELKRRPFGPVIERVLKNREAIDLDAGTTITMKDAGFEPMMELEMEELYRRELRAIDDWMVYKQLDALSDGKSLTSFGLKVNALNDEDWDSLASIHVEQIMKSDWRDQRPAPFSESVHIDNHEGPPYTQLTANQFGGRRTMAFQTREGGTGILQILGTTDEGLKIRYKFFPIPPVYEGGTELAIKLKSQITAGSRLLVSASVNLDSGESDHDEKDKPVFSFYYDVAAKETYVGPGDGLNAQEARASQWISYTPRNKPMSWPELKIASEGIRYGPTPIHGDFPQTLLFKNQVGRLGLLQVIGVDWVLGSEAATMRLRWKWLPESAEESE